MRRRVLARSVLVAVLLGPIAAPALLAADPPPGTTPAPPAAAPEPQFDRSMLSGAGRDTADLSRYERGNPVVPGTYSTDIYVNGNWMRRGNVRFVAVPGPQGAVPCIDATLFRQLGLRVAKPVARTAPAGDAAACVDVGQVLPGARLNFNQSDLRLDISVPQAWLGLAARGYVSPDQWDEGVPAALFNYSLSTYRTSSPGVRLASTYLGLTSGLNLGPWHLRQTSSLNLQSGTGGSTRHWQDIATYVQRDLPALRAQLTVGDSFTSGELFDSIGVRGMRLASDDRMYPESQRGYAPVIRGVATGNAKVSVSQNGIVIYQTTVAPGPFVIDDLFPTGYGGDLVVRVTEADGRTQTFAVPYASVAELLRPGVTRFEAAAGQVREAVLRGRPGVIQATVQHGFDNLLTGYAGAVGAQGYAALLAGGAWNTRWGALAVDLTAAQTHLSGLARQTGTSLRLSYSKVLAETGTSVSVAAYRRATRGYLGLDDALAARDLVRRGLPAFGADAPGPDDAGTVLIPGVIGGFPAELPGSGSLPAAGIARQRNRFDLSLSQRLGSRGGSLYATVSSRDYWNRSGVDTQFQLGYSDFIGIASWSVSANRVRDVFGRSDTQYYLSVSVPLGDAARAPNLSTSVTRNEGGGTLAQAMLSGSAGGDGEFNYGITASRDADGIGTAGSINGGWRSPAGQLSGSYGQGRGYRQSSFGITGSAVVHAGGITFGQAAGDTVALVAAPDAAGARLANAAGVRIGRSGYALVPYLLPYNNNTIELDPRGLPLNVELDATSMRVAPYAGAVVLVKFTTHSGRSLIVRARLEDGAPAPFGAEVEDADRRVLGVVGQGGRALVRGVGDEGVLTLRWQDAGRSRACSFPYRLGAAGAHSDPDVYAQIDVTCGPNPAAQPEARTLP